jgi:DNA-binding CsgD family transcriptional regulator
MKNAPYRPAFDVNWLERNIARLWAAGHNTADIAGVLKAREAVVANWLADMRDRGDARLRKFVSR